VAMTRQERSDSARAVMPAVESKAMRRRGRRQRVGQRRVWTRVVDGAAEKTPAMVEQLG
jgi:hypothetical protein